MIPTGLPYCGAYVADVLSSFRFLVGEGREVNLDSVTSVARSNQTGGHVSLLKDTAHHNYNDLPLMVHPSLQRLIREGDGPPKMFGGLHAYAFSIPRACSLPES